MPLATDIDLRLLRALSNKYLSLHALRVQGTPDDVPRETFVALAAQFPGALRELDRLPLTLIERRVVELAEVLSGARHPEPWMALQIAYHGFMRAVLRIRRELIAREPRDLEDPRACLESIGYEPAPDEPALSRIDARVLARIRKPPDGRLNPWVLSEVARDFGVAVDAVQRAFWGS